MKILILLLLSITSVFAQPDYNFEPYNCAELVQRYKDGPYEAEPMFLDDDFEIGIQSEIRKKCSSFFQER